MTEVYEENLQSSIVDYLLKEKENFGEDGLIKDEILKKYNFECPNGCSGNGNCFKSKN